MANHPTADLARFCARLQYKDLSEIVRERVRYLLLDHLAVTLRGSALPSSLAGYQMLEQMAIGSTAAQGWKRRFSHECSSVSTGQFICLAYTFHVLIC